MQTNTPQIAPNTSEIKTSEKEQSLSHRLIGLVNHVARSEEYIQLRSKKLPHTEAFRGAVDAIIESPDNGFNNFDSALLKVSSGLGSAMEAESELDAISERRKANHGHYATGDYDRSHELKLNYVIPFNHDLKSVINEGPNVKAQDLSRALAQTHTAVFSRYNNLDPATPKDRKDIIEEGEVMYRLDRVINGMRHEVATETMLSAAGIEYSYDVTVEEDARGVDIIAFIDRPRSHDGKLRATRVPIDIKSSFEAEQRTRDTHPEAIAVWTELERADFTGIKGDTPNALSISYASAVHHADSFIDRINTIMDMSEQHKANARRNIGRIAQR